MNDLAPITRDSEICQVLSSLPEKFIVDFANGIDVARDHLRVQRQRTGMGARFYDGFTGQGARRQAEINASLIDGVEGSLIWLGELTESLALSNYAIVKVNERLSVITQNVTTLAHYSANTRQQLQKLSTDLNKRCDQLSQQIDRIDFEQRAERQLEQVFNKWSAGRFNTFSLAGRCYAAMEELRWGVFGDYCRVHDNQIRQGFLGDLANRAISQLTNDARIEAAERSDMTFWLAKPTARTQLPDATDALAYLGDWSNSEVQPFVFSISQLPEQRPLKFPNRCNANRLAPALVSELFSEQYL
ncbi:MAG: diguanylate cyclase regulator RdcB family protein [Gallionella sp.]|nr:diguanylate cyclase regulator RdcB family protein [Gallionella sp.]